MNEIFTRPDVTDEEKDFLKLFSVFRGKVEESAARAVIPDSIFNKASQRLKHRNILTIHDWSHELHPLIREFCYGELSEKVEAHVKAADYYKTRRADKLSSEIEEKIYSHLAAAGQWQEVSKIIVDEGRNFVSLGYLDQLQLMIVTAKENNISLDIFNILEGDIAEVKGNWNVAKTFFEQAQESTDKKIRIEGVIKIGEMLHRMGSPNEANIIYQQAISDTEDNILLKEWHARAMNDLGLIYSWFENYKEALLLLNNALSLRETMPNRIDIAATIHNIAAVKISLHKLNEALSQTERGLNIAEDIGDKDLIGKFLHLKGMIKYEEGKNEEAMYYYKKSLFISHEIGSKSNCEASLNEIGTLLFKSGKYLSALRNFENSLDICEEIGKKMNIPTALGNVATALISLSSEPKKSCLYLMKSIAFQKEIGKKNIFNQFEWLVELKHKVGIVKFKEIVMESYAKLDESLKKYINVQDILGEPRHVETKIGRNDLCPCGSGKKYKVCHGKGVA